MTNASPSTTVAATTAPSSENTGRSPPGPNCSASPPARLPKSFMSVSMWRRRAGLTAQPQPAPARQSGRSMQGNNSAVNKRTVRHRRKIGAAAWHAAAAARRSTRFAVFPPWFSGLRGGERRALGQINDTDIRSVARKIRTPSRRLSSFLGLPRLLPMRLARALEGCA